MINAYGSSLKKLIQRLILLVYLLAGLSQAGAGQACSGVLGAAVVNETFGKNGAYQLKSGQTTYTAVTTCPNDGQYLIAPGMTCYSNNWHPLYEDHTPNDVKGNMLIVNASEATGEFYNQPVQGLCYGTTYEFSVWIINLLNKLPTNGCNQLVPVPLDPNMILRVELPNGQVLQTITTGIVPRTDTATWVRYATVFTLPGGQNSVVIKLINNGPGGCGNDLALDDIQLRPCRPQLQIHFPDATASTLSVCEGNGAAIRASLGADHTNPAYQWQTSTDSLTWHAIAGAGSDVYNAQATGVGKVYYRLLTAPVSGGTSTWDTTCSALSNTLTVKTLSALDCGSPQFYVPDAFTPNSDGVNDRFRVYYNESVAQLARYQLRIYNRWGSVIFVSTELTNDWDGMCAAQPCSGDVYTWVLDCQLAYANQVKNFIKEGRVILIR